MISEREARFRTRTLGWASLGALLVSLLVFGLTSVTFYLALLIPWIAAFVYRRGHGAIHLFVGNGDARPNVTHVYGFSVVWPGLVAVGSLTPPLRWELPVVIGVGIATLLAAVVVRDRRTWHWTELLVLLAANSFYGLGVAAAVNQDLDSGSPQTHTAQVLAKRIGRYRRHDYYYVRLAPWGPRSSSDEVKVDKQDYDRAAIRGTLCVELHPGALRIPWFQTKACGAGAR